MIRTAELFGSHRWSKAIQWGVCTALLHRLLLTIWMPLVWTVGNTGLSPTFHDTADSILPLSSNVEKLLFGVWRRWDAIHYFNLTTNGYRMSDPGPTVFGALTPLGFRLFDTLLPGGVDLAAMAFSTAAFALALTLLYRLVETYYDDASLALWSVVITALLPLSYYFAAPMSESIYLAMILATFFFATRRQWWAAALTGILATLARSQGVLMVAIVGLFLLQDHPVRTWPRSLPAMIRRGLPLTGGLVAFVGFELWRVNIGLPPLHETYRHFSYIYVTNPIDGLLTNLSWVVHNPSDTLTNVDMWALFISLGLALVMLRFPKHRRLPLVAFTCGYALLFTGKINYLWGTDTVIYTQSYARYALSLFPLTVLVSDRIRHLPQIPRLLCIALLLLAVLFFSGLHALGFGPA